MINHRDLSVNRLQIAGGARSISIQRLRSDIIDIDAIGNGDLDMKSRIFRAAYLAKPGYNRPLTCINLIKWIKNPNRKQSQNHYADCPPF